jgi:hypothetical protein
MEPDIFDVLDISFREDSYTRLLVEVLRRSRHIVAGVFKKLTGRTLLGDAEVCFRRKIGPKDSRNIPDLIVKGSTSKGCWWLVIEAKIKSGEGPKQTQRYRSECENAKERGDCSGYSPYYLTLTGATPEDSEWKPLTHARLLELVSRCDIDGLLERDPVLSSPWRAYAARVRRLEGRPTPREDDPLVPWLLGGQDEFLVTRKERAWELGPVIIAGDYQSHSECFIRQGREQLLIKAWRDSWRMAKWHEHSTLPLDSCVWVHFELDVPIPYEKHFSTCHLHCETNPYKTKRELEKLGDQVAKFYEFSNSFTEKLHPKLADTQWEASNRWLQRARLSCPLKPSTTIGELRSFLAPRFEEVADHVTEAMREAAKECGLDWWKTMK